MSTLRYGLYNGIAVCGVDCKPGEKNCNGYCQDRKVASPMDMIHAESGAKLIASERSRQVIAKGYTAENDAAYTEEQLARAADTYMGEYLGWADDDEDELAVPACWPWGPESWKPSTDPIRNLVKAGALIAAEIDRQLALALKEARAYQAPAVCVADNCKNGWKECPCQKCDQMRASDG